MADNDDAGGSGKQFWELSQELEEQLAMGQEEEEMEVDEEERVVEEEEMEDIYQDDMYIGEDMEGADDTTTTTSCGVDGTQRTKRPRKDGKDRKDQRLNQLVVDRHGITRVSTRGHPLEPEQFVAGYKNQLECIVRSTVPLHTVNLRSEDNAHYRKLLLQKLHARYKFPDEFVKLKVSGNPVNNAAISKMNIALASWKVRVKKLIIKGKTFEEAKKSNPTLTENDYE
jgi:hypothetical protein